MPSPVDRQLAGELARDRRQRPLGRRGALALFAALLACYAYFFPRWADWNQNSRFDLVVSLVDDRTLAIDRLVANTGDYARYAGHFYSDKAPGMALLGVPVYAAFRALLPAPVLERARAAAERSDALRATLRSDGAGLGDDRLLYFLGLAVTTFLTVALPSAALGLVLAGVARQLGFSTGEQVALALLAGLATPAFAYSNAFVGHQTSAGLLFAGFALLLAVRRGALGGGWLALGGFLLGYAAITEYPSVLIGAALGLYATLTARRPARAAALLAAGASAPLALLVAHDYAAFGTPLPVGYLHSTLWSDVHQVGLVSLTYPRAEALWGITFGLDRGLFFLSPYLLLAAPGYAVLWRRVGRPEFWVLLWAPLAFLLLNSSSAMWQGGFAVGPRYLVPCLPFLALAAGAGLGWAWRRPALRPVVALACAWSLFAVWAETIGGQSFPDYTANPLFALSLPRLAAGDVARNAGMLLGLSGVASLAPLAGALLALALVGAAPLPRAARAPWAAAGAVPLTRTTSR